MKTINILALISILIVSLAACTQKDEKEVLPNIIIYLSDDLGWKDLGFNGAKVVKTPNLDQLVSEGMVFDNAFIASPACAPSRAALLTGLMPARNGAEANHTFPGPEIGILTKQLQNVSPNISIYLSMPWACGFYSDNNYCRTPYIFVHHLEA